MGSDRVGEHGAVVSVPVALEELLRIMLVLKPEKLCELRVAAFHLLASCVPVVGQVIRIQSLV
jgi:hypothetical protein